MVSAQASGLQVAQFTIQLARDVGKILQERPELLEIATKSSATDVVTQMDQQAEKAIVAAIIDEFPNDSIVGEEGTFIQGTSSFKWVIDPLDGTVNYLYNLPAWAISIARVNVETQITQVGVVYAPQLARIYWAVQGEGAYLDHEGGREVLETSKCDVLEHALLGTGFGYERHRREGQARVLNTVLPRVRDIRRLGSCAIDLCLVAQGVLDAFYERGVNPWDHSAGALIAREAGAVVSGLRGQLENDDMIVVGNADLHAQLVKLLESIQADSDSAQ